MEESITTHNDVQDKGRVCRELLQVEIAGQPLGPGILQIDWDVFH